MQLTQGLTRARSLYGRRVAVTSGDRHFTWDELVDRVARLAAALRGLGMESGDRIAMLGENSHRSIEFYYAPCWGGGVFVPLNPRLSEAEILAQLRDAEPMALILDPALADRAGKFLAEVPSLKAVISGGGDPAPSGTLSYEALIAGSAPAEDARRGGEDLAALFYTGGTTGRAKGVMLSHANLFVNAMNTLVNARLESPPTQLHAGPLCHLAAGGRVFTNTLAGGRHVMLARFRPPELLQLIERERVTGMSIVPTMIGMLLAEPAFATADLSSLRVINYGGSPIPEPILSRFMARLPQVDFGQSYGMTELSPIATHLTPADHRRGGPRLRSAGRAVAAAEVGIMDEADRLLPAGEVGEVVIRGPIVMQGYWRQPELTRRTLRGGWMHSGDVGFLDEEGYLFIVDRKKDMVVSGGENVYSIEVEDAIHRHPAVAQCAVIGIPHETWGEAVHAVVVLRPGHSLDASAVIEHCRLHIASFKCPRSVELREDPAAALRRQQGEQDPAARRPLARPGAGRELEIMAPAGELRSGQRRLAFAELEDRVARAAAGFSRVGIGPGEAVALLLRNDLCFVEATQAAQRLGAYAVPINWHFKAEEVAYILRDCGARVLIVHADLLAALGRSDTRQEFLSSPYRPRPRSPRPMTLPAKPAGRHRERRLWEEWLAAQDPAGAPAPRRGDSMIYTSGTTGRPKGVRRAPATAAQITAGDTVRRLVYSFRPGMRTVTCCPLYHSAPNLYTARSLAIR